MPISAGSDRGPCPARAVVRTGRRGHPVAVVPERAPRGAVCDAGGWRIAGALPLLHRRRRLAHARRTAHMIFHERNGRLTRELLLAPGGFGLGQVPRRDLPDATTAMTCGYCSTGCGLNVHLR